MNRSLSWTGETSVTKVPFLAGSGKRPLSTFTVIYHQQGTWEYSFMASWIALFRGINVGGNNLLPMKDLVVELEKIGYTNIKTYIQSGNVIFSNSGLKHPNFRN
jgi:hypothetical protein